MSKQITPSFLHRSPALERSIWWGSSLFTFLVEAGDSNGQFCLIHAQIKKGGEPPTHIHSREEETFYILDGEITFQSGTEKCNAKTGEVVVLPRNQPHRFTLVTETASALLLITPGGFESFFKELSIPA